MTGIHAGTVAALRDYYGLENRPVKVHEPSQMLGLVDDDLKDAMGVDVVSVFSPRDQVGSSGRAMEAVGLQRTGSAGAGGLQHDNRRQWRHAGLSGGRHDGCQPVDECQRVDTFSIALFGRSRLTRSSSIRKTTWRNFDRSSQNDIEHVAARRRMRLRRGAV